MKGIVQYIKESVNEGIKMNNLDWGQTTADRNKNLDHFATLKTDKEKEDFKKKLKSVNESLITEAKKSTETPIGKVGDFDLIYQTSSSMNGGDGVSGSVRTSPQNRLVAVVTTLKDKLNFNGIDAGVKNIDKKAVQSAFDKATK